MGTQIDHNKLLKKIAKERLKPYGIFQKGQSRTFLCDKGWFTIVISFQPSSWSKGTYLNIGIDFNFYPRDYFAFNFGYRENGFEEFTNEEQFTGLINGLCDLTIKRVQQLEQKFQDVWTALKILDKEKSKDPWRIYDSAILNILTANQEQALKLFRQVSNETCEYEWQIERKRLTDEFISCIQDTSTILEKTENIINQTRQLKRLSPMTFENISERNTVYKSRLRVWLKKLLVLNQNP